MAAVNKNNSCRQPLQRSTWLANSCNETSF